MNRHYIIILILLFFGLGLKAQNITKVNAYQEGSNVIVTYHLDKATDIKVQVSTDGGKTYSKPLKKVSGDVGAGVKPGEKRIIWNALAEFEDFGGTHIVFKVSPNKVKAKFQHEISVNSGWMGYAHEVCFSVIPSSLAYQAGIRYSRIFFGAEVGLNLSSINVYMEGVDGSEMKSNIFSVDLGAVLRFYLLKNTSKVNPYLSAKVGYSLSGEDLCDRETQTYKLKGTTSNNGGLIWAASVGSSFRLAEKCALSFNVGVRNLCLDYDYNYSSEGTEASGTVMKKSSSVILLPVASLGITF